MAPSLEELMQRYPADRRESGARIVTGVRVRHLREFREQAGATQAQFAERVGVGQRQASKTEHGDIESAKVSTFRGHLEAVIGALSLECAKGDERVQFA